MKQTGASPVVHLWLAAPPPPLSGTHLKITASLSSQIVGSADFPLADSSARS